MPLYEYECLKCGNTFEIVHPINLKMNKAKCDKCKSIQPCKRNISAPPFMLIGEGWALDGYAKPSEAVKEAL